MANTPLPADREPTAVPQAIPYHQLGAKASAQYAGDGLAVTATPDGARLRCVFQKLEGEVTREGLWLRSTVRNAPRERFQVAAVAVGRTLEMRLLAPAGGVRIAGDVAGFLRPGLAEEYRVSVDGVRQDFVIAQRPAGDGVLRVELKVTGARVEASELGARLVLAGSGRQLNYHRLQVNDAHGKELAARMVVVSPHQLAVVVEDAEATYPVRIDPTFSDADWFNLGSGMNAVVWALAVSGNDLFAAGSFTTAGNTRASRIAKWDGSTWSELGAGVDGVVRALAVIGSNLYAGGTFTIVGETDAIYIAKWDGSAWSPLGVGVNNDVRALTVLGNDLYVGGWFSTAGGASANKIAKWDGGAWSSLGTGMGGVANSVVYALAASGSNLYAGGVFSTAGGVAVRGVARWNGESWSALGSGISTDSSHPVWALAIAGTNLYAAGGFGSAGTVSVSYIARWDGSSWSALGSGLNHWVYGLAVSGRDVYAGGLFTTAGGVSVNYIAKWDGSTWSRLGSGIGGAVTTLAIAGTNLYVGGDFTTAGGKPSRYIAKASVPLRTGPPIILEQPQSQLVYGDSSVTFSLDDMGELPLFYQWFKDGAALSNTANITGVESNVLTLASVQTNDAGNYSVMVSNAWGLIMSTNAVLTVVPAIPLAEALEAPDLVWTTGGDARWRGQTNTTFDGVDAAQSGVIGCDEQNWMETTVNGPGTLSFWWKIGPDAGSSTLEFWVNDQWVDLIHYEVDWNQVVVPLPPGPQVLHWHYTFHSYFTNGSSGWVDQVSFLPDAAPTLREQPQDQTVREGSEAVFVVSAIGTAPLAYQWRKNGTPLSNGSKVMGADMPTLTLTDVQSNDAGGYSVVVTNSLGSVTSSVARLTVLVLEPPPLVVSPCHPVANSAQAEFALSSAFDGTHFLIGLRVNTNSPDAVGAQRLSPAGVKVGPLISLGRNMDGFLDGPRVVWGGNNHLLVWTDAATQHSSSGSDVYAQFISPSGDLLSNAFSVCAAPEDQYARGAAYDGANFLVIWSAADGLRGRLVSPAGQLLGNELLFTPGDVQEAAAVAWSGSHYLVTWVEDVGAGYAAKGRLVNSSGQLGAVLELSQDLSDSYNPISVAFGGDRFLVVWHHNTDADADWNLRGRIVAPDGSMPGSELILTSGPEEDIAWANNVVFDGEHFLVVWTAYAGSPGSGPGTVWGRYWSRDGVPVGAAFTIESAGAGTLGLGLSAGGGQVMAVINRDAFASAGDVCARFITRPFVQIDRLEPRHVQVTFGGTLQYSTDLQNWTDYAPQPANPWINQVGAGALFLRARVAAPAPGP